MEWHPALTWAAAILLVPVLALGLMYFVSWLVCVYWAYRRCPRCYKRFAFPERMWPDLSNNHRESIPTGKKPAKKRQSGSAFRCPHCQRLVLFKQGDVFR